MEKGDFEKATVISDTMATRALASKVATAFDCVEHVKRQKVCAHQQEMNIQGKVCTI